MERRIVWAYWKHSFDMLSWISSRLTGPPLEVACSQITPFVLSTNCSPGGSISESSKVLPQRGKGEYQDISQKGEVGGACSYAPILQKFAAGLMKGTTGHKHQSLLKDFSVFLHMRRCKNWAHMFSKISKDLLFQFSQSRVPHSSSPPWALIRGCCGLAAAVAHVLLHLESDGKCQTSVRTLKHPNKLWACSLHYPHFASSLEN